MKEGSPLQPSRANNYFIFTEHMHVIQESPRSNATGNISRQCYLLSFSLSSLQVILGFPRDENIFNAAINPHSA